MRPRYFATAREFRDWLAKHYDTATELWVGFHKKGSGRPSITWPEAVDEALCFGWIDGIRKSVDEHSYTNRFTPRKPSSNWSAVNIRRFEELTRQRRMRAPGLKAFRARTTPQAGTYSYEQRHSVTLPPDLERRFRVRKKAWSWFLDQPPSYRSTALYWVMSARKQETRERRLATLIEDSAKGQRVPPLRRPETER